MTHGLGAMSGAPFGWLEALTVEVDSGVLVVTMNRPERLNAYDRTMVEELRNVWKAFAASDELRVAVLTAAGDRSFSTGLDVDDTLASGAASPSLDDEGRVSLTTKDLGIYKPVVVAVNGYCCAGGWHFVNDGDVILCSDNATFFDTHIDVGLANPVEAVGLASRLPLTEVLRMVASGRAYRMPAQRAYELGMVTEVVASAELLPRALEIARTIAQHPTETLVHSMEVVWAPVLAQRAEAEEMGLAHLAARHDPSPESRGLTNFRNGS